MKKEIADKWVEALRSGKYKQTKHSLRDETGFCCLGVLCDISGQGKWNGYNYETEEEMVSKLPPDSVDEWAGFITQDYAVRDEKGDTGDLTGINDQGSSFFEIADLIERNWRDL